MSSIIFLPLSFNRDIKKGEKNKESFITIFFCCRKKDKKVSNRNKQRDLFKFVFFLTFLVPKFSKKLNYGMITVLCFSSADLNCCTF